VRVNRDPIGRLEGGKGEAASSHVGISEGSWSKGQEALAKKGNLGGSKLRKTLGKKERMGAPTGVMGGTGGYQTSPPMNDGPRSLQKDCAETVGV